MTTTSNKSNSFLPADVLEKDPSQSTVLPADVSSGVVEALQSTLDEVALKRLNRKLDIRILPPLFVLYVLSFLDRGNIGNARIQGLEKSLHMKGQDYSIALFIFFIPYVLLEVPSNLILKRVAPSTWLSFLLVGWGQ